MDDDFHSNGRKNLLFVDNCPSHKLQPTTVLKAIKIEFLPPNYTSLLQPLDAGIIRNLKHSYRIRLLRQSINHMTEKHELKKVDLLEAITTISAAWLEDVKHITIANCFRHAGFGLYELQSDKTITSNGENIVRMEEQSNDSNEAEALIEEFANTLKLINNEIIDGTSDDSISIGNR